MAMRDTDTGASRRVHAIVAGGAVVAAAVAVVMLVHRVTEQRIAASEHERANALLRTALGGIAPDNDLLDDVIYVRDPDLLGSADAVRVHRARSHGRPVAALFESVAPDGYMGAIRLLVGIGADGRVLGVRVLSHRETPGLGDRIDVQRSSWILSFDGRSLTNPTESGWRVRKDGGEFDEFTGATVTPRAVVTAVHNTLLYFSQHRDQIFEAPPAARVEAVTH